MNDTTGARDPEDAKAEHGAPSEVTWESGQGRQPYQNQDEAPQGAPAAAHEAAEGDRGAASGRNLDQMEQVKRKP